MNVKSTQFALRIPPDLAKALQDRQAASTATKSAIIVAALRLYLSAPSPLDRLPIAAGEQK